MQKQKILVLCIIAIVFATLVLQGAHAESFIAHNHGIPILGVKVKYQFFNESTHYRAFFNRYLLPVASNVITLDPPVGTFSDGDTVHTCITEIYNYPEFHPQAQCSDPFVMDGEGTDVSYNVQYRPNGGL